MIKTLYVIGVAMLASAGLLGTLCTRLWREGGTTGVQVSGLSEFTRPHEADCRADRTDREMDSPLLRQAMAFALYLTPPEPRVLPAPPRTQMAARPVPTPPAATPRFALLSTSCCHSSPDRSLALVAAPGKGAYWVTQGDHLGHLIVESIEDGKIVCRDGNRRQEIAVTTKAPAAPLAQVKPVAAAAAGSGRSEIRPLNASSLQSREAKTPNVQALVDEGWD